LFSGRRPPDAWRDGARRCGSGAQYQEWRTDDTVSLCSGCAGDAYVPQHGGDDGGVDEKSRAAVSAPDLSGGVAGAGCTALLRPAGVGGGAVLAAAMAARRDLGDLAADA